MFFQAAGIEVALWIPPLVAFAISFFTSMGGVSGAFLLLPFQMSFLGYTNPSVSATNQLFNIVAIPSGVYRYWKEGRMVWPLTWVVVAGTLPGVFIGAVVMFTLLLVTGNTMAMAVRERVPELGVLKTLGFGDSTVLFLVLAEALAIALVGGAIGIGLAKLFTLNGDPTGGMLPVFYISGAQMASGVAIALFVGLAAGLVPALTAMKLRIVDALRRV